MNNKITYEEYDFMWFDLREGKITEEEWREFCDALFKQTREENKDVKMAEAK
jgi:polyhydroxyalkanoate synthesis regulator phasin